MARLRPLLFAGLLLVAGATTAAGDDLACNQDPRDRFFWLERAFCDLEMAGPQRAQGLIIWNHGIFGTTESWKAPAPPVLRIAQVRGWDVIVIKRHHLAETMPGGPLDRTVKRTLEEASARRLPHAPIGRNLGRDDRREWHLGRTPQQSDGAPLVGGQRHGRVDGGGQVADAQGRADPPGRSAASAAVALT